MLYYVKSLNPDIIVNATGSAPLLPPIAGLHENLGKVKPTSFCVETPDGPEELEFDYGFVCFGMKSTTPTLADIDANLDKTFADNSHIEIISIGDSLRARRIIKGTDEGRNILAALEKRGYL